MASTSSTAASTSSTAADSNHDVFISHRGPDVKKTFASHLYRRLLFHGIRAFLDKPELQPGDDLTSQIKGAIRSVSVHVAIFSSGYADSVWCLDELLLMLESKSPIIPIFYKDVEPADLRWKRSDKRSYADALEELEKKTSYDPKAQEFKLRYDSSTIEKWRDALSRVSMISGFELAAFNGDEGELLNKVVDRVLKMVGKPVLDVADYPTGLDDKVKDFENLVLLQQQSEKPHAFGIVGLGGVGKTTLATELFNRKKSDFSRSCILFNVRDSAGKGTLNFLQTELFKCLTGLDKPIVSVPEGKGILRKHISSSEVFLILDDVDDVDQIYAFLPHQVVLHPDSLVLVTSRNKNILISAGVEESSIYNLTGLSKPHSVELFCLHSFNQLHPLPEFESLVDKFVEACGGLPLSLKVFGALLKGKHTSYWEDQLGKLQRMLPEEIQQRLQISYDSLDREEKQIFLDIACFFIGEDRDTAIRKWDGGLSGFQNIQSKCLVEVNSKNKIEMHDHLRDLGRDIAKDSRLPRRLWRWTEDDIDDLLEQQSSVIPVRGIRMVLNAYIDDDDALGGIRRRRLQLFDDDDALGGIRMGRLQLLDTEDVLVERILTKVQSPNLIWLRWKNCPHSSLPSSLSMKNLRVLHVEGNQLERLWDKESEAPLQLRELDVNAPLSNIPKSIGKLKHLERIAISSSYSVDVNVTKLPEEFCLLHSLKDLSLKDFSQMKSLPERFGNLTNLQQICLWKCRALEKLPDSFGNLINLQKIQMWSCYALEKLPDSFGNLTNLQSIECRGCGSLERLPDSFCNLTNLQSIFMRKCYNLKTLPESFGNLTNLRSIDLLKCRALKKLPDSFGNLTNLQHFELYFPRHFDRLPDSFVNLTNLRYMRLSYCDLERLPDSLGNLSNLKKLLINSCRLLKSLPASIRQLSQLTVLSLINCPLIGELPFRKEEVAGERETLSELESSILPRLQKLEVSGTGISGVSFAQGVCFNLRDLSIHRCNNVVEIGTIPNTVIELSFSDCHNLRKIDQIYDLAKLEKLDISDCKELEELRLIETLVSLNTSGCVKLKRIQGLAQLAKLKTLNIKRCSELEEVEGIQQCLLVEDLDASGCVKLKTIRGLRQLAKLKYLDISGCSKLEELELEGIQHCVSLDTLKASGCVKLKSIQSIPGLGQLTKLRWLDVQMCSNLEDLEGIQDCMSLSSLNVSGCVKLKSIRGLGQLSHLDISGCSELEEVELEGIQHCVYNTLKASGCVKLKSIRGLLTELDISGSSEEELELGGIHCVSLYTLKASRCVSIQSIQSIRGLGQLTELQRLDVQMCSNLEDLEGIQHCVSLYSLKASGCVKLKSIRGLGQLAELKDLDLSGCSELEEMEGIQHCLSLDTLKASGCVKLKSIRGLGQLAKLTYIDITGCSELKEVEGIQHCVSLAILDKTECPKLQLSAGVVEHLRQRRVFLHT